MSDLQYIRILEDTVKLDMEIIKELAAKVRWLQTTYIFSNS